MPCLLVPKCRPARADGRDQLRHATPGLGRAWQGSDEGPARPLHSGQTRAFCRVRGPSKTRSATDWRITRGRPGECRWLRRGLAFPAFGSLA